MSRLTFATFLMLGCSAGPRGSASGSPLASALPGSWVPPSCYVEDSSARSADTVRVMFDEAPPTGSPGDPIDCERHRRSASAPMVVTLERPAGSDLRDALELGAGGDRRGRVDVLVTRDAGAISFARRRGEYLVKPLPWSATYVLAAARPVAAPSLPAPDERDALARDALTADTRGAAEPFAWLQDATCATTERRRVREPIPPGGTRPIIAYALGDSTARQLAERIISLARATAAPTWLVEALGSVSLSSVPQVVAMPRDSIPLALSDGRAIAAVFAVPRDARTRCGTVGDLPVPPGAMPLVDARAHAIVRRGSGAAFLVAPDGTLQFVRRAPR